MSYHNYNNKSVNDLKGNNLQVIQYPNGTPTVLNNAVLNNPTINTPVTTSNVVKIAAITTALAPFAANYGQTVLITGVSGSLYIPCVTVSTSTNVTAASAPFTSAFIGATVSGSGITSGTTVISVISSTQITLSAAAGSSLTTPLVFTYGAPFISLPTPSSGKTIRIVNQITGLITITPVSGQISGTVGAALTAAYTPSAATPVSLQYTSDGVNWYSI